MTFKATAQIVVINSCQLKYLGHFSFMNLAISWTFFCRHFIKCHLDVNKISAFPYSPHCSSLQNVLCFLGMNCFTHSCFFQTAENVVVFSHLILKCRPVLSWQRNLVRLVSDSPMSPFGSINNKITCNFSIWRNYSELRDLWKASYNIVRTSFQEPEIKTDAGD